MAKVFTNQSMCAFEYLSVSSRMKLSEISSFTLSAVLKLANSIIKGFTTPTHFGETKYTLQRCITNLQ